MDELPSTPSTPPPLTWQMLLDAVFTNAVGSERHLLAQLVQVGEALALAPEWMEQVQSVMTETLHHLLARTNHFAAAAPVGIRIYCNTTPSSQTHQRQQATSTEQPARALTTAGNWGFFVVEKLITIEELHYALIELYLYEDSRPASTLET